MSSRFQDDCGDVLLYDSGAGAVLIIAEPGAARTAALEAVAQAGMRARDPISFAEAMLDRGHFSALRAIVIEMEGAPEALAAPLLDLVDEIARGHGVNVVACVEDVSIDLAYAALGGRGGAQLLCRPGPADRLNAVAMARVPKTAALNDVTREGDAWRLQKLHEEVARIADALSRMTQREENAGLAGLREEGLGFRDGGQAGDLDPSEIRRTIRARRMRAQFFDSALFADPAWDMLLDLFAAALERRRVSVSSLCIAAAVPPTTALRWIGTLHEAGLFERHADPNDRRRAYIALSDKAVEGMSNYIHAIQRSGLNLV